MLTRGSSGWIQSHLQLGLFHSLQFSLQHIFLTEPSNFGTPLIPTREEGAITVGRHQTRPEHSASEPAAQLPIEMSCQTNLTSSNRVMNF
ncbi:hypothetical protein A6R68_23086 [Neotoma lepida]|uniref:Uncharacterized protein n=1 Tax=Neotoma lepida TaxID=56216 RepID=A0A1A6HYW2_NEOLE|nr:hypothetical protein A6R68_23086 [Neotoma lepida]